MCDAISPIRGQIDAVFMLISLRRRRYSRSCLVDVNWIETTKRQRDEESKVTFVALSMLRLFRRSAGGEAGERGEGIHSISSAVRRLARNFHRTSRSRCDGNALAYEYGPRNAAIKASQSLITKLSDLCISLCYAPRVPINLGMAERFNGRVPRARTCVCTHAKKETWHKPSLAVRRFSRFRKIGDSNSNA